MPCDVTTSPDGQLYISCEDGSWMTSSKSGNTPKKKSSAGMNIHRPGCMAVTSLGHVILCNGDQPSLLVYDAISLNQINSIELDKLPELKANNVCSLSGITMDGYGYIYIADTNNNRIIVLNVRYNVICILDTKDWFDAAIKSGDRDDINLPLNGPVGVAIDRNCHLVVLEKRGNVKVFRHMLKQPGGRKALFLCCI